MIDFDQGVIFVHTDVIGPRQFVTENKPAYRDGCVPYFRAFCVELPNLERPDVLYSLYYAEFAVKTEVLESDLFDWSDFLCEYVCNCDVSELDFARAAYLDEPLTIYPVGQIITFDELREHLRI